MSKKLGLFLALSVSGLMASQATAATVLDLNKTNHATLAGFQLLQPGQLAASNSLNTLQQLQQHVDRKGNTHTRYQQYFRGIPVWGKHVISHQKQGSLAPARITGTLVQDIAADVPNPTPTAGFDSQAALNLMKQEYTGKHISVNAVTFSNEDSKLVYYIDDHNKAVLAYAVNFFVDGVDTAQPARPYYIVDAKTKQILKYWNGLTTDVSAVSAMGAGPGGNDKIGVYEYGDTANGAKYPYFNVVKVVKTNKCNMRDTHVRTIDLHGGTIGNATFQFTCPRHEGDSINGGASPLNDAHFFGGVVFNMYHDWYNTAPLTFQMLMHVHYSTGFDNAFWDGKGMTFGDGAYYFYPLVALDVVGHEVSHGFTEQQSGLVYSGQSGGMNEAFSDIAGKAAEYYLRGNNNWYIGSDIMKDGDALRYMDDPTKDGQSIGDARDFDYQDVHYSSGVYNKAFYTLATTSGWNTHTAFDVMVQANEDYWVPDTNFASGAWGAVQCAIDMGYNVADVIKAFDAVGIACTEDECKIKEREVKKA